MSGVCACDHLTRDIWKYMSNTDKYENYCEGCGFECGVLDAVMNGYWCELYSIEITKLQ